MPRQSVYQNASASIFRHLLRLCQPTDLQRRVDRYLGIKLSVVTFAVGGSRLQCVKLRQRAREISWTNFEQFRQAMSGGELSRDKQGGNQPKHRDNQDARLFARLSREEFHVPLLKDDPGTRAHKSNTLSLFGLQCLE